MLEAEQKWDTNTNNTLLYISSEQNFKVRPGIQTILKMHFIHFPLALDVSIVLVCSISDSLGLTLLTLSKEFLTLLTLAELLFF